MSEHETIHAALVAALSDLTGVPKARTADTGTFSYDYAELSDIVQLTRPKLAEHGIIAVQSIHDHGQDAAVTTTLLHTSGESLDFGPLPFARATNAQQTGSAITYHRRYALLAALGLAAEDDDGAAASVANTPARSQGEPASVSAKRLADEIRGLLDEHDMDFPDDRHTHAVWHKADPQMVGDHCTQRELERVLDVTRDYVAEHADDDGGEAA